LVLPNLSRRSNANSRLLKVTVFHAVTADLSLSLPWPVPQTPPERGNDAILTWGGSSSVGQYSLQILRHWGYKNLVATASKPHHELLKSYGARAVFDYRDKNAVDRILESVGGHVPLVLDCIGSKFGSLASLSKIAKRGATVAILLPVIVRDSSDEEAPIYSMDANKEADGERAWMSRA
jgi:NADPH:quinone reductase-like Zn-dependent oxidoreductase